MSTIPNEKLSRGIGMKIVAGRDELEQAFAIRREVFIEEQSVLPDIEMDGHDDTATHVLAFLDGRPVGTARWRETERGIKLERFAVPKRFRGKGIGENLVLFVLDRVEGAAHIYLHAQSEVISFYEKYGFSCTGDEFQEAGIPHRKMVYAAQGKP